MDLSFVFHFLRVRTKGKFDTRFYLSFSIWLSILNILLDLYKDCVWIIGKNSQVHF